MDLDDAARTALALPGVEERDKRGARTWAVADKVFAWERSYSKADIRRFGDQPYPREPILAVRTAGLAEKEALLATSSASVFTIEHFDGFAAVLVDLDTVEPGELREVLVDGWLAGAPADLVEKYDG